MTKHSYFDNQIKRLIELSGLNQPESELDDTHYLFTGLVEDKEDSSLLKTLLTEIKENNSNQSIEAPYRPNLAWFTLKQKVLQGKDNLVVKSSKSNEKSKDLNKLSFYDLTGVRKGPPSDVDLDPSLSNKPQLASKATYLSDTKQQQVDDDLAKQSDQCAVIETNFSQASDRTADVRKSTIASIPLAENNEHHINQTHLSIETVANNIPQRNLDQDFRKLLHLFEEVSQETEEYPHNLIFFGQQTEDEFEYLHDLIENYEKVYPYPLENTVEPMSKLEYLDCNNQLSITMLDFAQEEVNGQFDRASSKAVIKQIEKLFFFRELKNSVLADNVAIKTPNQFSAMGNVIIELDDQLATKDGLSPDDYLNNQQLNVANYNGISHLSWYDSVTIDTQYSKEAIKPFKANYSDVINSLGKLFSNQSAIIENERENVLQSICQPLGEFVEVKTDQLVLSSVDNAYSQYLEPEQFIHTDSDLSFNFKNEGMQIVDSSGNVLNFDHQLLLDSSPVITMGKQRLGIFAEDLLKEIFQSSLIILKQLEIDFSDNPDEKNFAYYTSSKVLSRLIDKDNPDFLKLRVDTNKHNKLLNDYLGLSSSYHGNIKLLRAGFSFDGNLINQFAPHNHNKISPELFIAFKSSFFSQNSENISPYGGFLDDQDSLIANNQQSTRTQSSYPLPIYRCLYLEPSTSFMTLAKRNRLSFYLEDKELAEQKWQQYNHNLNEQEKISIIFNQLQQINANIQLLKDIKNIEPSKYLKLIALILTPVAGLIKHIIYQDENECNLFLLKYISTEEMIEKGYCEFKPACIDYPLNVREYIRSITLAPHNNYFVESAVKQQILDSGLNIGLNKLQIPTA